MCKSTASLSLCILFIIISALNNKLFASTYNFQSFNFANAYVPNKVNSIVQDESGYIWLATDIGLHRFDGSQVKVYKNIKGDSASLSSNFIADLKIDANNDLWIATDNGLNRLSLESDKITRYLHDKSNQNSLINNQINVLDLDNENNVWIATKGGLAKLNPRTNRFSNYYAKEGSSNTIVSNRLSQIKVDRNDNIWIGYRNAGLSFLNTKRDIFKHYNDELLHDDVTKITVDIENNVWVGYGLPGLSIFDQKKTKFRHIPLKELLSRTEQISAMHTTKNGNIWFGTFKDGVFIKIAGKKAKYVTVASSNQNLDGIKPTQITKIYQDRSDNIWLTTSSKGVYFISYNHLNSDSLSKYSSDWDQLVDNTVWNIMEDAKDRIWIGTDSKGVQLIYPKTKSTLSFQHEVNSLNSLSDNRVLDILETKSGQIWLATSRGINLFDEEQLQFKRFFYDDNDPLSAYVFSHITEDHEGNIWAATFSGGLVRIKNNFKFEVFQKDTYSLSDDFVTSMVVDNHGMLWIGTRNGLNSFNIETQRFREYDLPSNSIWSLALHQSNDKILLGTADGLIIFDPDNNEPVMFDNSNGLAGSMIYCILQAEQKIIVSTEQGISTIDSSGNVLNYSYLDGLQQGYNLNSCAKLNDDTLYFGGDKGISFFNPKKLTKNLLKPRSLIINFKAYDEVKGRYINQVLEGEDLQLHHSKNNVKFYFVGIFFEQITSLNFQYRLIGLNDSWSNQDLSEPNVISRMNPETVATYTNLSPGDYQFQVKFQSQDDVWSNISSLSFQISTPWWQSKWTYLGYLCIVLLLVYSIVKWRTKKINIERIALEQKVKVRTSELESMARKARQLSLDKTKLFANVSHEFKNPLTLILGPIEQLITKREYDSIKPMLTLIQNNANRLLHLVERLLSFSKVGQVESARHTWVDVEIEVRRIIESFQPIIISKKIKIELNSITGAKLQLVEDSFETILINLLSNALKFTKINGSISVKIFKKNNHVNISVTDTGVGISLQDTEKVFDYFFRGQLAIDSNIAGTGIGLALVQQLVKANDAELNVVSELGKGSTFTVSFIMPPQETLLKSTIAKQGNINIEHEMIDILDSYSAVSSDEKADSSFSGSILIIEDNPEMGDFIKSLFENEFACYNAKNGELGIELAQRELPDIIICDVMMPGITGFDVITKIREVELTCHIPILMLTAKGDFESRQTGWQLQADEYISKPFNTQDLINRIKNLLSLRVLLKKRFSKSIGTNFADRDTVGMNEKDISFISRFENVIFQHFRSSEFDRQLAAKELAMSERQLNRKLAALVDHNFSEYLRKFRLVHSLSLQNKGLQVAEVAEKVGFSSLSYFSTCFKAEFGVPYSEYSKG
jgi:signal transduction histidine kinase/DNA-binding response OmpR family regulator/streptogramin lyase